MTGSIHRQYSQQNSSTTGTSEMDKTYRSKLHQCSTDDNHDSFELIPDDNQYKEILFRKRDNTTSDIDSGTEEIEQQLEHMYMGTHNDNDDTLSTKSFGPNPDEGFSECEHQAEESKISLIQKDLELAKKIPDDMKKDFCADTSVAFHGEFARLISLPLALCHGVHYRLFAEEELLNAPFIINFHCIKLDNAKAQFKCPNISCQHAWTSMRARISFSVSGPDTGYIVLKIFGQNCQLCGTNADALWYIDEVCRVMKNLAKSIFETYFPDMLNNVDLEIQKPIENNLKPSRHSRHDPNQRKGKMHGTHVKEFCEACRHGFCFPQNN